MLSIIDDMLIGLMWKLEVGVKGSNERVGAEEEGILGYQQTGQITLQTSAGVARCQVATLSSMCSSTTHLLRPLVATIHR